MRRNWFVAAIVIGLAAIVVAAVAARLTNDEPSDVDSWASSVCTSVSDWRDSITALADVQAGDLNAETLGQKIDDAEAATDELVSELRDLGRPDLESGDALESELEATADSLREEYEALEADAQEALEAGSPAAFLEALAALAPSFQSLLTSAASALEDLESAPSVVEEDREALRRAFEGADSCQALRAETGS